MVVVAAVVGFSELVVLGKLFETSEAEIGSPVS